MVETPKIAPTEGHGPPQERARRGRPPLDPIARRMRILAIASKMFIAAGYTDTTLEAVGKAAGVTKRTIYELVGDKTELFRAVCDHCHADIGEFHLDLPVSGESLRGNLVQLAHELIAHALSDETIAVERTVVIEQARFPDLLRDITRRNRQSLNRKIAVVFEKLSELRMISPVDSFKAAEIFFDLVVGNVGFRKALGFDEDLPSQADIDERVDTFIDGYLHRHGLPRA